MADPLSGPDAAPTSGPDITPEVKSARRLAFGGYAADYDRVRPGWPAQTAAWLLGDPAGPLDVLDLGCGTGKGTAALVALGHRVVGVDPSEPMLAVLRSQSALATVRTHVAGAEDLPLADGSVDAITCFQAWHWVDPQAAAPECVRVLREGGLLGMAWHRPDRSVDWVFGVVISGVRVIRRRWKLNGAQRRLLLGNRLALISFVVFWSCAWVMNVAFTAAAAGFMFHVACLWWTATTLFDSRGWPVAVAFSVGAALGVVLPERQFEVFSAATLAGFGGLGLAWGSSAGR